jgi:hypothetical protein
VRGYGLGGRYQDYQHYFDKLPPNKIFFLDNATDHIHIQVWGDDMLVGKIEEKETVSIGNAS